MIDLHCHILVGIDDGPQTLSEALKMARIAVKDGVHTIIATPHCFDGVYDCQHDDIETLCQDFNDVLERENIALRVLPGAEIRLIPELGFLVERGGNVGTLGGKSDFILLELPEIFLVDSVIGIVESLKDRGVRTILAHPERNKTLLSRSESLERLIGAGVELQLTGGSLLGLFGREPKKMAIQLLKMDVRCYLGSDAHGAKTRKPGLAKPLKVATGLIGWERAAGLVSIELDGSMNYV